MVDYESRIDCTTLLKQGAEAKLYTGIYLGKPCIIKERFSKQYRHPILDRSLTQKRTKSEVRSMMRCRSHGISAPAIYFVDTVGSKIYMEYIEDSVTVRDHINQIQTAGHQNMHDLLKPLVYKIGQILGNMHNKNIIHGDLTTSNMLLKNPTENLQIVMIDFGLGYMDSLAEDKGVDLYVLERAFLSTHPNTEALFEVLLDGYKQEYGRGFEEIISKFEEVRQRGRKRTMLG